jgi:hypothetical protein
MGFEPILTPASGRDLTGWSGQTRKSVLWVFGETALFSWTGLFFQLVGRNAGQADPLVRMFFPTLIQTQHRAVRQNG